MITLESIFEEVFYHLMELLNCCMLYNPLPSQPKLLATIDYSKRNHRREENINLLQVLGRRDFTPCSSAL